jgi:hypothetical protein
MAELRGESSPYLQVKGQLDLTQKLTGKLGLTRLSGKIGAGLTSTETYVVSGSAGTLTIKEDSVNPIVFPEYLTLVLSTNTTAQIAIDSWVLDEDMDGSSVAGTFQHEAVYTMPEHILGTKPQVFFTVNVKPVLNALGGTKSIHDGYVWHVFNSSDDFEIEEYTKSAKIDFVVVGGGGASGRHGSSGAVHAGGGGGGAVVVKANHIISKDLYSVTIGAGGVITTSDVIRAGNGEDSSFDTYIAKGGGSGGNGYMVAESYRVGADGGCGGGAGNYGTVSLGGSSNQPTYEDADVFGNAGAPSNYSTPYRHGGGGGGAGGNPVYEVPGPGKLTFAGTFGKGGDGSQLLNAGSGTAGAANTGEGGNAPITSVIQSYAGGSGVVVIRYSADYILE